MRTKYSLIEEMPVVGIDENCLFFAKSIDGTRLNDVNVYVDAGAPLPHYIPFARVYLANGGREIRSEGGSPLILPRDKPFEMYEITDRDHRRISASGYTMDEYRAMLDKIRKTHASQEIEREKKAAASR